jgi:general secretion pathway protein E/type IV pilus assembly protein PilB
VTEAAIRDVLAKVSGNQAIDLATVVADIEALRLVPQEFARH